MSGHSKNILADHPDLAEYITGHSSPEAPLLQELYRDTYVKIHHPRRTSDHLSGKFLQMVCWMMKPRRVLEIGTFTGYGALAMAAALPEDAELHTIEINDELEGYLRSWFRLSPHGGKIHLHIGDALEIIPRLEPFFDLIFIDGEKNQYPAYYQAAFEKLVQGGIILADNALWSGKVLSGNIPPDDHFTHGIREFNNMVQSDPRVENLLLPVFDGIMVVRKL